MRVLLLFVVVAGMISATCVAREVLEVTSSNEIQARRQLLEDRLREKIMPLLGDASRDQAYRRKVDLLRHPHEGNLIFLPALRFLDPDVDDEALNRLCGYFSEAITKLAREALEADEGALAYQLLHEAAFFDSHEQTASRVIGAENRGLDAPKATLAQTRHPRLNWPSGSYWRVTTDHYQIVTDHSEQAGIDIAQRLEELHAVWSQLFFDCWSSNTRLEAAWKKERALPRESRMRHRVVLFTSRDEYVRHLQPRQPRIDITLGFYDVETRTSYFFAGRDASTSTQIHEATHQLFQELQKSSPVLGEDGNFWIIEGVALYMESLLRRGPYATVGGFFANRLQFARYRRLQEGFYVPLSELVLLGRRELQADPRIRKLYSQSAGLTHFFMDGESRMYRHGVIQYVRSIHQGRDRAGTLGRFLETDLPQLDTRYGEFLDVSDVDVQLSAVQPDEMVSLCLGRTSVTDVSLLELPSQRGLDWLDLSHTPVTDAGLRFVSESESLRQVSLERTQITDRTLTMLAGHRTIDELDLSHTVVSDEGVRELTRLPNLRRLWLTGTRISDQSLGLLAGIASLEELGCGETQVTASGREKLTRDRPDMVVE